MRSMCLVRVTSKSRCLEIHEVTTSICGSETAVCSDVIRKSSRKLLRYVLNQSSFFIFFIFLFIFWKFLGTFKVHRNFFPLLIAIALVLCHIVCCIIKYGLNLLMPPHLSSFFNRLFSFFCRRTMIDALGPCLATLNNKNNDVTPIC